jgi:hypothetical protein
MPAGFILILPTSVGVQSRSDPMAGKCLHRLRFGSVGRRACRRCLS